jgi:hypothetical protein
VAIQVENQEDILELICPLELRKYQLDECRGCVDKLRCHAFYDVYVASEKYKNMDIEILKVRRKTYMITRSVFKFYAEHL